LAALGALGVLGARAAEEDIHDIRGPKYVLPAWVVPVAAAGAALLAAGAYGIWRRGRRARVARVLSPYELTLQRLEEIRGLMRPAGARTFGIAVSDVVRSYIEQRFQITATHSTTQEFLQGLLASADPALVRHRALLSEFLEQCDLVKFAGESLTLPGMESLHHSACTFVRETHDARDPLSAA
jgi:hypothetical protein